jgi:hypothetical protein
MTVTAAVGRVGRSVGTVVPGRVISVPVGLVHPLKSAQITTPKNTSMTRDFCILSAFIFGYF